MSAPNEETLAIVVQLRDLATKQFELLNGNVKKFKASTESAGQGIDKAFRRTPETLEKIGTLFRNLDDPFIQSSASIITEAKSMVAVFVNVAAGVGGLATAAIAGTAALFYFGRQQERARAESTLFKGTVEGLRKELEDLDKAAREAAISAEEVRQREQGRSRFIGQADLGADFSARAIGKADAAQQSAEAARNAAELALVTQELVEKLGQANREYQLGGDQLKYLAAEAAAYEEAVQKGVRSQGISNDTIKEWISSSRTATKQIEDQRKETERLTEKQAQWKSTIEAAAAATQAAFDEQTDAWVKMWEDAEKGAQEALKRTQQEWERTLDAAAADNQRFLDEQVEGWDRMWEEVERGAKQAFEENRRLTDAAAQDREKRIADYRAEHNAIVGLRGAFRELGEESTKWGTAARGAVLSFSDSLANDGTDALIAFGEQTESERKIFKKFAASVLRDIARIIIQTLILKAVQAGIGAIGGAFENSGGGYDGTNNLADHIGRDALAKGDVFLGSRRQNFGSGTVLTRPTVVGLSRGGLALGGEAGEEGLFPLRRDRQGRLGISGGAPSVTVHYHSSAVSTAEESRMIQRNAETIAAIVSHKMRSSSSFRDSMRVA